MKKDSIETAKKLAKKLTSAGHTAYFAGGAPRDILMGNKPNDIDIATSAKPEEVEKLFPKTIPVGKSFGVVIVVEENQSFEVATFRKDTGFSDHRRPDSVSWCSACEDAKRRDFTCNGLFYDPKEEKFIDYVDGKKDIKEKVLRFIGNPEERIDEDNLRILRAIRFKNKLGFTYDQKTKQAIIDNADKIKNVSAERIREELTKILLNENRANSFHELSKFGILKKILPELEEMKNVLQTRRVHAEGDVWEHTMLCLKNLGEKKDHILAWAVLLHDVGKPETCEIHYQGESLSPEEIVKQKISFHRHTAVSGEITEKICKRLKFSKKESDEIVWLVKNHLRFKDLDKMKPAKAIRLINHPYIKRLLEVSFIDSSSSYLESEGNTNFDLYNRAKALYDAESKKPKISPLLSGNDIMKEFKIKPGPEVGRILKIVEDGQLEGKIKTKEEAISYARDKVSTD